MYPYILFFLISCLFGYLWEQADKPFKITLESILYFVLFIFIGLKYNVGTDSVNYLRIYNDIANTSGINLKYPEMSYYLINNFSAYLNGGMLLVYMFCGAFFSLFTWLAAREFKINPCYFFAITMPFHLVMLGISGIRQGVAESIVIYALALLWNEKNIKFIVWIVLATTFHSSALFFASFALLKNRKRWLVSAMAIMLPVLLLVAEDSYGHYMEYDLFSQGVVLRVGFLLVPLLAFIYYRKTISQQSLTASRLFYISILVVPLLAGLALVSTTLVDRIAYYFILLSSALVLVLKPYIEPIRHGQYLTAGTLLTAFMALLAFSLLGNNAEGYAYNSYLIYWLSNIN